MFLLNKNLNLIITISVLIFSTQFFQSTILEVLFFKVQVVFFIFILFFLFYYFISLLLGNKRANKIIIYYLFIIILVPLYSAFRANISFGQPLLFGILSARSWILCGVGIWFFHVLTQQKISFKSVESAFIIMAWLSLVLYSAYNFMGTNTETSFFNSIGATDQYRGVRFRFQNYFITFGSIFYFIKYNINKNYKYLLYSLMFIAFTLFIIQGRTYTMVLFMTFLTYYLLEIPNKRKVIKFINFGLFIVLTLFTIQSLVPSYFNKISDLYSQMFHVLTGVESNDYAANARIFSSYIVFDYWDSNPSSFWFGTGRISNQWNEGYNSLFGYFFPSDIGALGGLFLFGIFGSIFLFIIPILFSINIIRKLNPGKYIFILSMKYILIFSLFRAIQGSYHFKVVEYLIPMFLLLSFLKLKSVKLQ